MSQSIYGNPWNLPVGKLFFNRKELIKLGAFNQERKAIAGNIKKGACAVILQGGYLNKDEGNIIYYTGEGGFKNGVQFEDQSDELASNKALLISHENNIPIRVFRSCMHESEFSPSEGYSYAGLYEIANFQRLKNRVESRSFEVLIFELHSLEKNSSILKEKQIKRIEKGSVVLLKVKGRQPKFYSIGVDHSKASKLDISTTLAQNLYRKQEGEIIKSGSLEYEIMKVE